MDRPNRSHPTLSPLTSLPTSPSYLYPTTSIPTTPSLLSRPSSQTRLQPSSRSVPTTSASTPALQKHHSAHPKRKRPTTTVRNTNDADEDDWIARTASTLTLTRLEEKGQAWLAARRSSTSLTAADEEEEEVERGLWDRSARGSSAKLKAQSRRGSIAAASGGGGWDGGREGRGGEDVGPDFVDVEEEEEEEGGEEVDEGEMKRVVMGRVGGWVDWAVGWMDFRGEGEDGEEEEEEEEGDPEVVEEVRGEGVMKGELDPVELQKRLRRKKRKDEEVEIGGMDNTVGSAPERAGVWSDARWLLRVAAKAAL